MINMKFLKRKKNGLYFSGSKRGVTYEFAKIQYASRDKTPSFISIISAMGTPVYKLAKFCY